MIKILALLIVNSCWASSFNNRVDAIKKSLGLTHEVIGIHLEEEDLSYSRNKNTPFYPASTFKILTAFYILESLGADYTYKTNFGYKGVKSGHVLTGDLILNVTADPFLLTPDLYNMAYSLKRAGIKEVKGNLIVTSSFPNLSRIGAVGLDDQPYNQGLSGFNLDFNRFKAVRTSSTGHNYFPKNSFLKLVTAKNDLSPGEIFKRIGSEVWEVTKLAKNYYEIPIRDTLNTNAHIFNEILKNVGIKISGSIITKDVIKSPMETTYTKQSQATIELVSSALEYSNNLFMEVMLLSATHKRTLKSAALKMRSFYQERYPELKFEKVNFINGSGLSTETKLYPWQLAKLLNKIKFKSYNGKSFITLLSLAGHGGFLAKRFLNDETYQGFFAKTGSLDYVNGICGLTSAEQSRGFCIYINNFEKRERLKEANSKELQILREQAKPWKRKTDQALERILRILLKS